MEAYQRQKKILEDCAQENTEAHKKYDELIKAGHRIVLEGKVVGPYTTRLSYWLSDGSFITLVTPSSLAWTYKTPIFTV